MTAGDVLTLSELRQLRRTSALRGAGLVLHAGTTIATARVSAPSGTARRRPDAEPSVDPGFLKLEEA